LYHKIFQKEKEKNRIIKIKTHNPKRAVKEAKYKYQKKKKNEIQHFDDIIWRIVMKEVS
jgi:hypothetical protein